MIQALVVLNGTDFERSNPVQADSLKTEKRL